MQTKPKIDEPMNSEKVTLVKVANLLCRTPGRIMRNARYKVRNTMMRERIVMSAVTAVLLP